MPHRICTTTHAWRRRLCTFALGCVHKTPRPWRPGATAASGPIANGTNRTQHRGRPHCSSLSWAPSSEHAACDADRAPTSVRSDFEVRCDVSTVIGHVSTLRHWQRQKTATAPPAPLPRLAAENALPHRRYAHCPLGGVAVSPPIRVPPPAAGWLTAAPRPRSARLRRRSHSPRHP